MNNKLAASVLLLTTVGCISVSKSVLSPNPTGRILTKEEVTVYFENDSIPQHTRVAILNAKGDSDATAKAK